MAKKKVEKEPKKEPQPKEKLDLLAEARTRFKKAMSGDKHNRTDALDDLRFLNGENQWDEQIKKSREGDGRPCLVWNNLATFVDRVVGDQRQNRPSAKVHPTDKRGSKEGARIREGLIRAIESDSFADIAYDNAFQQAVSAGLPGHIRVATEYAGEDTFDQIIKICRVRNQFSVVWDPAAQEWDKSDANYLFVWTRIPKEDFEALYPGKAYADFQVKEGAGEGWYTDDTVVIAEYFRKEFEERTLYELKDDRVVTELRDGEEFKRKRTIRSTKINRYLISGYDILEDATEWPSRYWPLIPVEGKEIVIDDKVYNRGLIRNAKDAQKAYNFSRNAEIELFALAPKAPYLLTPRQVEQHEDKWKFAHKKTYPYLLYNPDPRSPGPPKREDPPPMSTAITTSTITAKEELKFLTSIFDSNLGAPGNEISGKGIMARQMEGGLANYVFVDNLVRAIIQVYKVIIDLMPKIYDTHRILQILGDDGTIEPLVINQPALDDDGKDVMLNDMTEGRYEVSVTFGPSYATQRMEAAAAMLNFLQAWPQAASAVGDLVARVQDWPGADKFASRLKGLVPRNLLTKQEIQDLPQPGPPEIPPMLKAKMAVEKMKVQAKALDLEKKKLDLGVARDEFLNQIIGMVDQKIAALVTPQPPPGGIPQGPGAPPGPGKVR